MKNLETELLELIRFTSTNLPEAVETKLRTACDNEAVGSAARLNLETILKNVALAREKSTPLCQDTGTPLFFVRHAADWSRHKLTAQIRAAVAEATRRAWLRPNAVNALDGINSGDNLGDDHFPSIHFEEVKEDVLIIDLMLKGGGCENVSVQYSLPDETLAAKRDLEGVRRVALDTVWKAQGEGCAPGFLGIAIGGDRATSHQAAKEVLLRPLDDKNPSTSLAELEGQILAQANQLGIGPMGLGGKTTLLGAQISAGYRLPASYFVSIAYMCWAFRHRRMTVAAGKVSYE